MNDGLRAAIEAAIRQGIEDWDAGDHGSDVELNNWTLSEFLGMRGENAVRSWLVEREPTVEIGAWLLPEGYGPDYDHFTQTKAGTIPGQSIALFARKADIDARSERARSEAAVEREPTDTAPSEAEIDAGAREYVEMSAAGYGQPYEKADSQLRENGRVVSRRILVAARAALVAARKTR